MKTVKFEKRDRIAYITLNRPDALNALNDQLNEELAQAWTFATMSPLTLRS